MRTEENGGEGQVFNFAISIKRKIKGESKGERGQVLNLDIDRTESKQMRNIKNKDLTPFHSLGNLKDQKNKIKQPYTYTGREWDKEAGLYYYRARYYDAKVGRFISFDPIVHPANVPPAKSSCSQSASYPSFESLKEDPQKLNPYSYVENNPINYTDPAGLSKCEDDCLDSVKKCYMLAGGVGITTGIVCNTVCIATTKAPVFCRTVCSATAASIAGYLQVKCYKVYLKCKEFCNVCK